MNAALAIHKLTKIYPNGTRAVNNVSFSVSANEIVIILGLSGAGKSTLLRCLNRLLEPTSGRIELNGHDISHARGGFKLQQIRKQVGMIFQQFNLVPRLTVLDNVIAGRLSHCGRGFRHVLSLMKYFSEKEKTLAFECLKRVRIEHLAYQRADTLSGGQQQRVAIARALAQEPIVFLADEPVASLDPASAEIVMNTLRNIHESHHIPIIINLHQVELARRYATRILGMANGEIVFDGEKAALTPQAVERIYGVSMDEMKEHETLSYEELRQGHQVNQPDVERQTALVA